MILISFFLSVNLFDIYHLFMEDVHTHFSERKL